jgi:hypothetical protein
MIKNIRIVRKNKTNEWKKGAPRSATKKQVKTIDFRIMRK